MTDEFIIEADPQTMEALRRTRRTLRWTGIVMAVLGVAAIIFPTVSTAVTGVMIGWLFLISGGITLWSAFSLHGTGAFLASLILGLLMTVAGVFLIFNPMAGALALTILVAVIFLLDGAFQLFLALDVRPARGWGWLAFSAVISLAVGILIAAGLPGTGAYVLGILVGIGFLTTGISFIALERMLD